MANGNANTIFLFCPPYKDLKNLLRGLLSLKLITYLSDLDTLVRAYYHDI